MQETIVITCEDRILHTEVTPFYWDITCPCREDRENVNALTELVEAGLLTTIEANLIMRGATIEGGGV